MRQHLIQVIIGSVRLRRIGPQIAEWVAQEGRNLLPVQFEIIDLKDWPLPMDNEAAIPATGHYDSPESLAWSQKIAQADAFVFVTPQYNWGYPAALKNAIDHLYLEWKNKAAMIATYGSHGGNKCAEQLRQVLTGLKMEIAQTMPGLALSRSAIEANSGVVNPASDFASSQTTLEQAFKELNNLL